MIVRVHQCRSKGIKPLAWVIMLLQGMNPFKRWAYNHMAISYVGQTGNWKYADSTYYNGVKIDQHESDFDKRYKITHTVRLDVPASDNDFMLWLERHKDKQYDVEGLIGLALKTLKVLRRNPFGDDFRRMTCNELILSMISQFYGYTIGDSDNYDLLMTADLVESI